MGWNDPSASSKPSAYNAASPEWIGTQPVVGDMSERDLTLASVGALVRLIEAERMKDLSDARPSGSP